jgi:hypothetical protein
MKTKIFLLFLGFLLIFSLSFVLSAEKTGEYSGSFDVNVGDAGIVIGPAPNPPQCEEDWTCSYWSSCTDGIKTFICDDCNNCGTYELMPENCGNTQSCSNGGPSTTGSSSGWTCTEEWECSEWSECINQNQKRTCTESNNCGTTNLKPSTSRNCTENNKELTGTADSEGGQGSAGITGGVIGALKGEQGVVIGSTIFIVLAAAALTGVTIMKKKGKIKLKH